MKKQWMWMVVGFTVALAGCHGSPKDTPVPLPVVPVTTQNQTVTLDAAVPQALGAQVAAVLSPMGAASAPGTSLAVPTSSNGTASESMVLAVDAGNNILLASVTGPGASTTLSADSTALVLARLALGTPAATVNPAQINAAIRAGAGWPNLVTQVQQAAAAGTSPATSTAVYDALLTLLGQIGPVAQGPMTPMHGRVHPLAAPVVTPSVTTPAPYTLNAQLWSGYRLAVVGAQGQGVEVSNTMPITWALASADTDGLPLCASRAGMTGVNPNCSVLVDRMDMTSYIGLTLNLPVSRVTTSTGGNGDAFNLTVQQNPLSRTANVTHVVKDLVLMTIDMLTAGTAREVIGQCVGGAVDALLPPAELATLALAADAGPIKAYLNDLKAGLTGKYRLASLVSTCMKIGSTDPAQVDGGAGTFAQAAWAFVKGFGGYVADKVVSPVTTLIGAGGTGMTLGMTVALWNTPDQRYGVCMVKGALANCATQLSFNPSTLRVAPSTPRPTPATLKAKDGNGLDTLVPDDIEYVSDQPSVVAVVAKTGTLTVLALPAGTSSATVTIKATDRSTGLNASYTVVVAPEGFTKVSDTGQDLPADAPTWSCVRHNATGLLWEAHVTRGTDGNGNWILHPCSWDAAQQCSGYTNLGNGSPWDAPSVTGSVCGKPGRLPTLDEGTALVSDPAYVAANSPAGTFKTTWFGADDLAWWGGWSSSPVVGSPSLAWIVDFYGGYGGGSFNVRYGGYYVGLVAGP
jgi:hypothetical protein